MGTARLSDGGYPAGIVETPLSDHGQGLQTGTVCRAADTALDLRHAQLFGLGQGVVVSLADANVILVGGGFGLSQSCASAVESFGGVIGGLLDDGRDALAGRLSHAAHEVGQLLLGLELVVGADGLYQYGHFIVLVLHTIGHAVLHELMDAGLLEGRPRADLLRLHGLADGFNAVLALSEPGPVVVAGLKAQLADRDTCTDALLLDVLDGRSKPREIGALVVGERPPEVAAFYEVAHKGTVWVVKDDAIAGTERTPLLCDIGEPGGDGPFLEVHEMMIGKYGLAELVL